MGELIACSSATSLWSPSAPLAARPSPCEVHVVFLAICFTLAVLILAVCFRCLFCKQAKPDPARTVILPSGARVRIN